MSDPFELDPVTAAVQRYFQRFPELDAAQSSDPMARALFVHIERALKQADMAMQDEGFNRTSRRRVITAALYGSVDGEAAMDRVNEHKRLAAEMAGKWGVGAFREGVFNGIGAEGE